MVILLIVIAVFQMINTLYGMVLTFSIPGRQKQVQTVVQLKKTRKLTVV